MSKLKHYKAIKGLIQHKGKILLIETIELIGGKYEFPGGRKLNSKEADTRFLKKKIFDEVGLEVTVKKRLIRNLATRFARKRDSFGPRRLSMYI